MKDLSKGNPKNIPGFEDINEESQNQVIKSFEFGNVEDRSFSGAPPSGLFAAESHRVEHAKSRVAKCHGGSCGQKIDKYALRLGYMPQEKPGFHQSYKYYHWSCLTEKELAHLIYVSEKPEEVDGYDELDADAQRSVFESFKQQHIIYHQSEACIKIPKDATEY